MMATSWKPTLGWLQSAAAGALLALLAACGGGGGGGGSSTTITPPADTTPPTVVITDDVTAATATGPVTLRFGFSEDVGTSFDSGDVFVTSGTAGAFTRIDGTAATLVVTPAANTQGALGASIAAGAFRDLAGNANAVPASYARAFDTTLANPGNGWILDWADEFDGNALDASVWNFDLGAGGWGNNELESYQAANATVAGGVLTITARRESVGGASYTSARLQTSRKKTFTYGRLEMRAKLPATQGMWPAFWLLGASCDSFGLYGGTIPWPKCGEIDIMEMIGGLADGSGDYTTHGTIHYLNAAGVNPMPSFAYRSPTRLADGFHVYAVDWTSQSFTWSIDGIVYGTKPVDADMTAFQQPFFLLLNLAVGGNWGGYPDATTVLPQTYVIDYVRHYHKAP
jgi:beta-glucanase (GH16 family)